MPRNIVAISDDEEPLEDKTAALELRSKRTERMQKKETKRRRKRATIPTLTKLPTELLLECLKLLQPSDVFHFGCVSKRCHSIVDANAHIIGDVLIKQRYPILARCFPLPKRLIDVDANTRACLVHTSRQNLLWIHHRPYQHVQRADDQLLCTCLTCVLGWNNLNLVIDFAHWQFNLDKGIPIPMIPRGQMSEWNQQLVERNADLVKRAMENSLWYARILEAHLMSTVRSIRRHAKNKGNKRKHVDMTDEEAAMGTDAFLAKAGPPSHEFPYRRDEYYMLDGVVGVQVCWWCWWCWWCWCWCDA